MSFQKFYQKSVTERQQVLKDLNLIQPSEAEAFASAFGVLGERGNQMIENYLWNYEVPYGLATDFLIDGEALVLPLATEEPSVVAAASFGAKTIQLGGGFHTQMTTNDLRGEIAFYDYDARVLEDFEKHKATWIEGLYQERPNLRNYGEIKDLFYEIKGEFLIFYLVVDTGEAMGANLMNSLLESLAPILEVFCQGKKLMAILSNLCTESLVEASFLLPYEYLSKEKNEAEGKVLAERIVKAYRLAVADPYRACTHNKGVMNGIQAFVLASGNDTRATEAAAHTYASLSGRTLPLTQYALEEKGLRGRIALPLHLGVLGGTIENHPMAKFSLDFLKRQRASLQLDAKDLAKCAACLGLAQNFSALRALVSVGIQKGHMKLHSKAVLSVLGASPEEEVVLLSYLEKHKIHSRKEIQKVLEEYRKGNLNT